MNVFDGYGVEIKLPNEQDFLKVRETLTRIGIASFNPDTCGEKGRRLIQSCHVLHKQGQYAIMHFKELFKLDGKDVFTTEDEFGNPITRETIITEDDIARRNTIAALLADWGLVKIVNPASLEPRAPMSKIKIIPYKEKDSWELVAKHSLGRKKR